MNRTLLLILCDFLLLNLLALTRWETVEPVSPSAAVSEVEMVEEETKPEKEDDMAKLLKMELEQQSRIREELARKLAFVESNFQTQEKALAGLQRDKQSVEADLARNQSAYKDLSQQYSMVSAAAAKSRQDISKLNEELDDRQKEIQEALRESAMQEEQRRKAEAQAKELSTQVKISETEARLMREQYEKRLAEENRKREEAVAAKTKELQAREQQLAALETERRVAEQRAMELAADVKGLNAMVRSAEKEKEFLARNVSDLKTEVTVVREEKERLRAHAERLTAGVKQLAETSTKLTDEFRDSIAINMNQMFHQFLTNRVEVKISGEAAGLFGTSVKESSIPTLLARDRTGVYAIVHVADTPFAIARPAAGLDQVATSVTRNGRSLAYQPLEFLAEDPRLIAIPVNQTLAEISGLKIYDLTADPFRFPKAVLISKGGKGYGEAEFRLDPQNPDFVKMKGGGFRALFGEFSPSTGDLALSKSGELLGVMVNSEYCVLLRSLNRIPGSQIKETDRRLDTKRLLEELKLRIDQLPYPLQ